MNQFNLPPELRARLQALVNDHPSTKETLKTLIECINDVTVFSKPYYVKCMRMAKHALALVDQVSAIHLNVENAMEYEESLALVKSQLRAIRPKLGN